MCVVTQASLPASDTHREALAELDHGYLRIESVRGAQSGGLR
jgi:hypothetical protein